MRIMKSEDSKDIKRTPKEYETPKKVKSESWGDMKQGIFNENVRKERVLDSNSFGKREIEEKRVFKLLKKEGWELIKNDGVEVKVREKFGTIFLNEALIDLMRENWMNF